MSHNSCLVVIGKSIIEIVTLSRINRTVILLILFVVALKELRPQESLLDYLIPFSMGGAHYMLGQLLDASGESLNMFHSTRRKHPQLSLPSMHSPSYEINELQSANGLLESMQYKNESPFTNQFEERRKESGPSYLYDGTDNGDRTMRLLVNDERPSDRGGGQQFGMY